jgi:hypothetical protein
MNKENVLAFVISRSKVASESCNSQHINCVMEQIRGAIWLFTGKDPGKIDNSIDILDALSVPYKRVGDMLYWGDEINSAPTESCENVEHN